MKQKLIDNLRNPYTGLWLGLQALIFFIWLDPKPIWLALSAVSIIISIAHIKRYG